MQMKRKMLWYGLIGISVLIFSYISVQVTDTDVYYLIAQGKNLIETGNFDTLYGFPFEMKTVIQNYGWCVIVAEAYGLLGNVGLFLLQSAVYVVYIVAGTELFLINCKKDVENYGKREFVALLVALAGFSGYINLRPELITLTLIICEVYIIEKYRKTGDWKCLMYIPVTVLIEAQIHLSMLPFHLICALPYLVPLRKEDGRYEWHKPKKVLPVAVTFILSFLAGMLNEYGINGILYVFKSFGNTSKFGIMECQPMQFLCISGIVLLLFLVLFVKNFKEYEAEDLFLVIGMSFTMMLWIRQSLYLPLVIIVVVRRCKVGKDGEGEENGIASYMSDKNKAVKRKLHTDVFIIAMLVGLMLSESIDPCIYGEFPANEISNPCYEGLDAILSYIPKDKDRIIYTEFIDGAYLNYRGYKAFMDARPELYYKDINGVEDYGDMYLAIHNGSAGMDKVIEEVGFTDLIVNEFSPAYWYLLSDKDFDLTIVSCDRVLFQKKSTGQ